MAKFKVAVTHTETQVFIIEAECSEEAIEKISDAWDNGELELDNPEVSDSDVLFIGRTEDYERAVL